MDYGRGRTYVRQMNRKRHTTSPRLRHKHLELFFKVLHRLSQLNANVHTETKRQEAAAVEATVVTAVDTKLSGTLWFAAQRNGTSTVRSCST